MITPIEIEFVCRIFQFLNCGCLIVGLPSTISKCHTVHGSPDSVLEFQSTSKILSTVIPDSLFLENAREANRAYVGVVSSRKCARISHRLQ
jgi:hypothetical protein